MMVIRSASGPAAVEAEAGEDPVGFQRREALPVPPGDYRQHLLRGNLRVDYLDEVVPDRFGLNVTHLADNVIRGEVQFPASDDHPAAQRDHARPPSFSSWYFIR